MSVYEMDRFFRPRTRDVLRPPQQMNPDGTKYSYVPWLQFLPLNSLWPIINPRL